MQVCNHLNVYNLSVLLIYFTQEGLIVQLWALVLLRTESRLSVNTVSAAVIIALAQPLSYISPGCNYHPAVQSFSGVPSPVIAPHALCAL